MTTPPPDTQVQSKTLEWIASEIANSHIDAHEFPSGYAALRDAILSALRNQIERCAEIAEKCHPQPCTCQTCLIRAEAGAAIRKLLRPSGKDGNKDVAR